MKQLNSDKCLFKENGGFTLIEVIAVLIIIGILSTVVANRVSSTNPDLYTTESALKTHIRYAQSKAMHSDTTVWGLRMNSNNDVYWIFNCTINGNCNFGTNRVLPPGGDISEALFTNNRLKTSLVGVDIASISIGSTSVTRLTIVFDKMGVPFTAANEGLVFLDPMEDTNNLTRLTSDLTISLTDSAANTKNLIISHETGFVQ